MGLMADTADATIDEAPLPPGDKLRIRLWLALIDGFVENGHIDVAWQIANAIDQHWRSFAHAMYQEGLKDGRSAAEVDAARHRRRDELEAELLTMPLDVTH
jgi:hypothetical protein